MQGGSECPTISVLLQTLLLAASSELSSELEKRVLKSVFNRLGALQADNELRQLSSYLKSLAGWVVKEKLTRLSQIVSVLTAESVAEAADLYDQAAGGASVWRLSVRTPSVLGRLGECCTT